MEKVEIFLKGVIPAQKNSKQIAYNRRTGKPFVMSSKRVKDWQDDMAEVLDILNIQPIKGPVEINCKFVHKDKRKKDLDNEFTSVCDLLKNNNIIEDDNCFILRKFIVEFGGIDKENPGVYITIKPIDKPQTV